MSRLLWIGALIAAIGFAVHLLVGAIFQPPAAARVRSREVPIEFQRQHPCPSTGRTRGHCPGYIRDHIIPLCAGGADATWNLQWQTTADSLRKDEQERALCRSLRRSG